jgi:hypothetical protein
MARLMGRLSGERGMGKSQIANETLTLTVSDHHKRPRLRLRVKLTPQGDLVQLITVFCRECSQAAAIEDSGRCAVCTMRAEDVKETELQDEAVDATIEDHYV